jgi:multidrug resistance efflux pump
VGSQDTPHWLGLADFSEKHRIPKKYNFRSTICFRHTSNLRIVRTWTLIFTANALFAASSVQPTSRIVRATGLIRATHSMMIQVPRIQGQSGNLTLVALIRNGTKVRSGDLLAEFDRTSELKAEREARAKFDDLAHQVEQKQAEHRSNAEKRAADLIQARADLKKAQLEMRKGPTLSVIDQEKNQVKLEDAKTHVASLEKSNHFHDLAEFAEIRGLELQRDRQKLAVDRAVANSSQLELHARIDGMVALQNVFRNNSLGHPREGDQLWGGSPLMRIFDPSEMEIELSVGEPDGAILIPGAKAKVRLDAYPGLTFTGHLVSASPVATAPIGSKVKTFSARFALDQNDPHLLPDLSAAADIEVSQ